MTTKIIKFIKDVDLGKITMREGLPIKTYSQPLSNIILDYLREAIIKNEIKPRNIIREKDIAAVFNYCQKALGIIT